MKRGDVSFTFMHRVEEIEMNIEDGRWQSALALALTLPDICGAVAFPDIVKRYRDGRIRLDRQKNPTRDVGGQYTRWFDEYAGDFFKVSKEDSTPYICGERCWQLRCEYLHQNRGFLNDENESSVRFHLGVNCGTSVCQTDTLDVSKNGMDVRIDIKQFCLRMCAAARNYYDAVHGTKNFSLYNTPVLDFIQAGKNAESQPRIAVACENAQYGEGVVQALKTVSEQVFLFRALDMESTPDLWIVTDEMIHQTYQPWYADSRTPVILLTKNFDKADGVIARNRKLTVLRMPFSLEMIRNAVKEQLRQEV